MITYTAASAATFTAFAMLAGAPVTTPTQPAAKLIERIGRRNYYIVTNTGALDIIISAPSNAYIDPDNGIPAGNKFETFTHAGADAYEAAALCAEYADMLPSLAMSAFDQLPQL